MTEERAVDWEREYGRLALACNLERAGDTLPGEDHAGTMRRYRRERDEARAVCPATCSHAWEPLTAAVSAEHKLGLPAIPDGAQWCGRCRSLRRAPREAPLPEGLSPVEKVTHVVAREVSYASPSLGAEPVDIIQGLLLVAADLYVATTKRAWRASLTPEEKAKEWAALARDVYVRAARGALSLVR